MTHEQTKEAQIYSVRGTVKWPEISMRFSSRIEANSCMHAQEIALSGLSKGICGGNLQVTLMKNQKKARTERYKKLVKADPAKATEVKS